MRLFLFLTIVAASGLLSAQEVIITGVLDGTLSGGQPRAIELYVNGTVDLSTITINRYANGSTAATGNNSVTLSGTFTDAFVYAVREQAPFASVFGTSGDFANVIVVGDAAQGTGDDVYTIEAVAGGTVLDQAGGVIGVRTDVYNDSYLYRNDNTGPDGDWVPANWTIPGNDVLLGEDEAGIAAAVPFGTYSATPPGPNVSATANGNLAEPNTNGGFTISLSQMAAADVTVTYTLSGTATPGTDYNDALNGTAIITTGQLSVDVALVTIDDADPEPTETIELTLTGVSDNTFTLGNGASIVLGDDEPVGVTRIHTVQGSGFATPLSGQVVTVEGIVVADFQGGSGVGLGGFFVQEEDADVDADPATSEGIWVFDEIRAVDVALGDRVRVTGRVAEFQGLTEIETNNTDGEVIVQAPNNPLPTAAVLDLPVSALSDFEAIEGMRVTVPEEVVVSETFVLGRFGEFVVAPQERLIQYTECNTPNVAGNTAYQAQLDLTGIPVDDGRSGDNTFPISILGGTEVNATDTWRSGTRLTGLTGIMDERFPDANDPVAYRIQGTGAASVTPAARPATPPTVGGNLSVVGVNVLNYFTTLGSRGARNADELERQETKIAKAL
ncbi:MAG: hypothetical protein AAFN92_02990 [Bacteroidota bacterium]